MSYINKTFGYNSYKDYIEKTKTKQLNADVNNFALDINGNQIPFTHTWWDSLGNYNPLQYLVNPLPPCPTVDDGSCEYGGCMDPLAGNYNASATFSTGG